LTFTGLDISRQYQFQFGYGDKRTGNAYNETVTLASGSGAPVPVQLAFGSAAAGDDYALLMATVTNSTSLVLTLPQTVSGFHGPMQAGFSVHLITPYDNWANGTFVPALTAKLPGDNQDGDSLTNLQEYAFGTQPTVSTGEIEYVNGGAITTTGTPKTVSASGMYSMVFGRRADYVAAGLIYTVQFSAGLDTGVDNNDTTNPPVQVATDGTINAMSVPYVAFITTPSGTRKPTFSRVKVELAP
jgi:hypothetical protein